MPGVALEPNAQTGKATSEARPDGATAGHARVGQDEAQPQVGRVAAGESLGEPDRAAASTAAELASIDTPVRAPPSVARNPVVPGRTATLRRSKTVPRDHRVGAWFVACRSTETWTRCLSGWTT